MWACSAPQVYTKKERISHYHTTRFVALSKAVWECLWWGGVQYLATVPTVSNYQLQLMVNVLCAKVSPPSSGFCPINSPSLSSYYIRQVYHHMKSTAAITGHLLLVLQLLQANIDIATPASVIRCANGEYAESEQLCGTNAKADQIEPEDCSGDNCINGSADQPKSAGTNCTPVCNYRQQHALQGI